MRLLLLFDQFGSIEMSSSVADWRQFWQVFFMWWPIAKLFDVLHLTKKKNVIHLANTKKDIQNFQLNQILENVVKKLWIDRFNLLNWLSIST